MRDDLKIYICDDDLVFANAIKNEVELCSDSEHRCSITVFDSPKSFLKAFDSQIADVVFLDIDMPELNGFEVAEIIQKRKNDIIILFVTSHEDKVYESYEYHPFWFIRKSFMQDLKTVFPKVLRQIDIDYENKKHTYNLKGENHIVEININTVKYIESYKNDIIIHDKVYGERKIRCKIAEVEKQLYPFNIIRIQNGILVNCRFIKKITSREVILTDESKLCLSRFRIDYVKSEFHNFVRSIHVS